MLTDPIRFTLGEQHVTSATSSYSSAVGTISGIVASILAILLAVAAIVFYRRHRSHHGKAGGNGNVAFENPTYTRGLEQVQVCIMCVCVCVGDAAIRRRWRRPRLYAYSGLCYNCRTRLPSFSLPLSLCLSLIFL